MGLDTIQVWEYEKADVKTGVMQDLSKPERDILETLSPFNFLTAEQLTRLLYSPTSHAYVQRHLRGLVQKGFLDTILPPKQTRFGSTPYVYILTTPGRNYLSSIGMPVPGRFRPSEERRRRGGPLLHSIAVNEVLLNAKLLTKQEPDIDLVEFVTEREFNQDPLRVDIREEDKTVSLSPDLWLHIKAGKEHTCICFEVNLTPVEQKRWRQKVRSYYDCLPSYKARFGTDVIIVAVIVASPLDFPLRRTGTVVTQEEMREREREAKRRSVRLEDLLRWTEREIVSQNALDEADLFVMTEVAGNTLSPESIFLRPRFMIPTKETPVSLIPYYEEAGRE